MIAWWQQLIITGLVLTVVFAVGTLLMVLVHMHGHHGVAIHWKCDEDEGPPDDNYYADPNEWR